MFIHETLCTQREVLLSLMLLKAINEIKSQNSHLYIHTSILQQVTILRFLKLF